MLAPIVLFAYNRISHTQETIDALRANPLAKESEIFIYSDAAKTEKDIASIKELRHYLKTLTGFKRITIIEHKENQGLTKSIVTGITDIINKYGTAIVLEDDIVVASNFLQYMNEALECYKDKKDVWHIAGYQYPINVERFHGKTTAFVRTMTCWGWATWKDRWQHFERDPEQTMNSFNEEQIRALNCGVGDIHPFWVQVKGNYEGVMNTWGIFWYITIFLHKGLCLNPIRTFVRNIGLDGSGEHCSAAAHKIFESDYTLNTHWTFSEQIIEDLDLLDEIRIFYTNIYYPRLNIFQTILLYLNYFRKKSLKEKYLTLLRRLHLHK